MARHVLVVRTRPLAGMDAQYNEWYQDVHLPEVLDLPGFKSAERFSLAQVMMAGPHEADLSYLAIYEVETDDISATLEVLKRALPEMTMSPALDAKALSVVAFRALDDSMGATR